LWPFYKKSETLQVPTRDQEAAGNTYNPDYHGTDGPLTVSFPAVGIPDYFNLLENTAANFSIERNRDFNGGDARGVATYPGAYVIRATREQVRWSSADAYYLPAVNRKNLELVDQTSCLRVVFDDKQGDGPVRAKGVEIAGANQPVTITAKKEVILAAGVYRSPGILEYSGVGNKKILSQYNINSTIDLPGVGENYQDQMQGAIWFKTKNTSTIDFPEIIGDEIISNYLIHANIDDVAGDVLMDLQKRTNASLPDYAKQISERINGSLTADQILNSLRVQYDAVFDTKVPAVEFFSEQRLNDSAVNLEFWPLITMTRGSVHISGKLMLPSIRR
jgi:choline dehydrogenase-like flavoprotein